MTSPTNLSRSRIRFVAAVLLAGYWVLLFISTHIPLKTLEKLPKHSDKWLHLTAYAGLSFLAAAWLSVRRPVGKKQLLGVFGVAAVYGVIDELLQIPVNRHCEVWDWLADCVGAAIGLAVFAGVKPLARHWLIVGAAPAPQESESTGKTSTDEV